jgi:hypothetical protein
LRLVLWLLWKGGSVPTRLVHCNFKFTNLNAQLAIPTATPSHSKMEGACGKVLATEDPAVVVKQVYRKARAHRRTTSLRAPEQAKVQMWAHDLCVQKGFKTLYVPRAWDAEAHQYKMARIDVSQPVELTTVKDHSVAAELKEFYLQTKKEGIFPADFELYQQADGRVAMVDFDKFAEWKADGSVLFPWGLQLTGDQVAAAIPL